MDPVRDLDIINEELRLKDEEFFMKVFEDVERKCVRGSEKKLKPEYVRINFLRKFAFFHSPVVSAGDSVQDQEGSGGREAPHSFRGVERKRRK